MREIHGTTSMINTKGTTNRQIKVKMLKVKDKEDKEEILKSAREK